MALTPGTRLGPYAVTAPLGSGGRGEVYRATDTRLDRTVAIKVLPEHLASDPELRQRFEREAKTLAAPSGSLRVISYARPGKLFTASHDLVTSQPAVLKPDAFRLVVDAVVDLLRASAP